MNWVLRLNEKAKKNLRRFPHKEQERINGVLIEMSGNPYSGDIVKLDSAENLWRRRVGNYRIFYEIIINDRVVYVYNLKRRSSNTY